MLRQIASVMKGVYCSGDVKDVQGRHEVRHGRLLFYTNCIPSPKGLAHSAQGPLAALCHPGMLHDSWHGQALLGILQERTPLVTLTSQPVVDLGGSKRTEIDLAKRLMQASWAWLTTIDSPMLLTHMRMKFAACRYNDKLQREAASPAAMEWLPITAPPDSQSSMTHLAQHFEQKVLEVRGHDRRLREAQRLMLHHLEQLEDVWGIEGNAPEGKGVQAGAQGIHVSRPTPAPKEHGSA